MPEKLDLYVPRLDELWFRAQMMADPATMSYNAGWNVDFDGYHRDTGCIDFPPEDWHEWYDAWIGQEPERFYAYVRRQDGMWIGEVNVHYNAEYDWWDMGIVLDARFRGQGFAVPALQLLLEHAFVQMNVTRIHNDFEIARNEMAALNTHLRAGFRHTRDKDGFMHMLITRKEYIAMQR